MKRQIIIDSDARKRLQEAFGVTRVTVWKALNYESDNELARKIRYTAKKEMGGIEINGALPGFETVHDTAGRITTQTFGPRVKIILYWDTNRTAVLVDGEVRRIEDGLTLSEFMSVQGEVYKVAQSLEG